LASSSRSLTPHEAIFTKSAWQDNARYNGELTGKPALATAGSGALSICPLLTFAIFALPDPSMPQTVANIFLLRISNNCSTMVEKIPFFDCASFF